MTVHDKDVAHTDILADSLVDRYAPKSLIPYLKLARLDRPIGTWLLLVPGWWGIVLAAGGAANMTARHWILMLLFGVGAVFLRGAGCTINDIWDRDIDGKVERTRTRPLPSGALKLRQALVFLFFQLSVGLLILVQMNALTIGLGFLAMVPVTIYPLMKRVTWWPQLFLGLTFNWSALMGWTAVTGSLDWPVALLYASCIFWTLGYDTIYAHQDKEDDALIGIKSSALFLQERSRRWIAGFYAVLFAGLCAVALSRGHGLLSLALMALPLAHLVWQLRGWDMDDQANCLKLFKSNRHFGWLVLIAFLAA